MSAPALVPSPLYGLRTWSVVGARGAERLAGPQLATPWPDGGEWLEASCSEAHAAPAGDCTCGIHAWHPSRRATRRVLAVRSAIPGVVEARGAIEVHRDGFRAERARPYALMVPRRGNAALARRLAAAYDAELVPVDGPRAVLAWCRARGLGLEPGTIEELIGSAGLREQQRRTRATRLKFAAAVATVAALLGVGLVATDDPGDRTLNGRTGEVRQR